MSTQLRGGGRVFVLALCVSVPAAASTSEQLPYGANRSPGVIKAYDFDQGGEGAASHDSDAIVDIGVRGSGRSFYLSRSGAGVKDGSSWSQAFSAAQLPTVLNQTLAAGDTLYVAGGLYESSTPYSFTLTTSGTEALNKRVVGVDLGAGPPVFKGLWTPTDPGSSNKSYALVRFTNAHYWDIQGLTAEGYYHGVRAENSSHLELSQLHFRRVREGFSLSNVSQAKLLQSDVLRYTKRGIRLSETVSELRVEDFTADATTGDSSWPTEAYPFGVSVENPADAATPGSHDLVFNRVTMKNNTFTSASGYQNGDGFSLERTAFNVSFLNSAALDNTDGGWDDKSQAAYYENCVALRNKRNFRLWNDNAQPTILNNVLGAYAQKHDTYSTAGLWSQGYVEVYDSTFFANEGSEIVLENNATPAARVKISHSILSDAGPCGALASKEGGTTLELVDNKVCEGAAGTPIPLRAPSPDWSGHPADAFSPVNAAVTQGYRPVP